MAIKGGALDFLSGASTTIGEGIALAQQKRAKNKEAERLRNLEKMEADRKASGVVRQVGKRDKRGPGFMPGGGFGTRLPAAGQPTVTSPQEGGRNIFSKTAGAVRDRAGDVVGAVRDKAGDVTGFAGRKVKGAAGAINRAIRGQDETSRTKIGVGTDRLGVGLSGDTREQRQDKSQFSAGLGKARTDKIQADRERTDQYQYAGYQLGPYAGDPRAETKLTERPVAKATTQTADSLKRGSGFMPGGGLGTRLPAAGDSSADTKPRPFSDTREGTDTTIIADPFGQRNRKKEQRARDTQRTATPQEAKDVGRGTLQDTMFGGNRPDAAFVDPESKRILEGPAAGVTQAAGRQEGLPPTQFQRGADIKITGKADTAGRSTLEGRLKSILQEMNAPNADSVAFLDGPKELQQEYFSILEQLKGTREGTPPTTENVTNAVRRRGGNRLNRGAVPGTAGN